MNENMQITQEASTFEIDNEVLVVSFHSIKISCGFVPYIQIFTRINQIGVHLITKYLGKIMEIFRCAFSGNSNCFKF